MTPTIAPTGPPDPDRSRLVLIGASEYRSNDLEPLPGVRKNLTGLGRTLADRRVWGVPEKHHTVLARPESRTQVLRACERALSTATDTLVVYYAGHGVRSSDLGDELALTLHESDPGDATTMLAYRDLARRVLLPTRGAPRRVVILDCCYAGRAAAGPFGTPEAVVLAAVNGHARAGPGSTGYTTFTGALIRVLNLGVAGPEPVLTLGALAHELRRVLSPDAPAPYWCSTLDGLALPIAVNRGYRPVPVVPPAVTASDGTGGVVTCVGTALWDAPSGRKDAAALDSPAVSEFGRDLRRYAPGVFRDLRERATPAEVADLAAIAAGYLDEPAVGAVLLHAPDVAWLANLAVDTDDAVQDWALLRRSGVDLPVLPLRATGTRRDLRSPVIVVARPGADVHLPWRCQQVADLVPPGPLLVVTTGDRLGELARSAPSGRRPVLVVAVTGTESVPAGTTLDDLADLLGTVVLGPGRDLPPGYRPGRAARATISLRSLRIDQPVIDPGRVATARAYLNVARRLARPAEQRRIGTRLRLLDTGRPVLVGPARGGDLRILRLPEVLDCAIEHGVLRDVVAALDEAGSALERRSGSAAARALRAALEQPARARLASAGNQPDRRRDVVRVIELIDGLRAEVARFGDHTLSRSDG